VSGLAGRDDPTRGASRAWPKDLHPRRDRRTDGNPVNELEVTAGSLLVDGVLCPSSVIKLVPEQSVLGLRAGDPIRLTADDVERLSTAFFEELEARFV
jgi:hypothetical protein